MWVSLYFSVWLPVHLHVLSLGETKLICGGVVIGVKLGSRGYQDT